MWIFLAVLLAVSQASTPVPRQAANNPTSTGNSAKNDRSAPQEQTAKPEAAKETITPTKEENPSKGIGQEDAEHPIRISELPSVTVRSDWLDYANPILNLLLAALVGIQTYLLRRTLIVVEEQTEASKTAAAAARDNVQAARDNAKAAEQAAEYAKQGALEAKANAEAASLNAATAKEQVEMFISKERARIRVEMVDLPAGRQLSLASASDAYEVKFKVVLYGQTDAFIAESGINVSLFEHHPNKISFVEHKFFSPIWNIPDVISPTQRVIESNTFFLPDEGTPVPQVLETKARVLIFHGFIKYKDVFDRPRETWFRYLWEADERFGEYWGCWTKDGPPQDNHHT